MAREQGHFPEQVQIEAYGNGGFRFADMSHRGSLLCLPGGMYAWDVTRAADISEQSLARVLEAARDIDVLLLGTGEEIVFLPVPLQQLLRQHSIIVEAVGTGSAVRTYNILLGERRAVAAALISVERAKTRQG